MKPHRKARKISAKASARGRRPPLSRERIELAALDLIEQVGLEEFSTRKLGEVVGCEAMSIYHHFPSKSHLLNALLDRVLAARPLPAMDLPPVEWIRQMSYWYRAIGTEHPRLFQYIALHRMNTRTGLGMLNTIINAFKRLGLDAETTARLFRAYSYYLTGAILDETSGYAKGPSAADPVPEEEVTRNYPHVVAAGRYFQREHFDRTFSTGLEIFLRQLEDSARAAKKRK